MSFPTTLTNYTGNETLYTGNHAQNHNALEAKLGIDGSAVATSIDYLLKNSLSLDPGHKHTLANGASDVTASVAELNVLDGIPPTLTATELGYVDGVTSAIQTQIDSKQATISLTASRAVVSTAGGILGVATTTATEIGYVNGVTSAIQTQINAKAPSADPTFTGTVTSPVIQGSASAANFPQVKGVKVHGASGTTETVSFADGDRHFLTLDENITITLSNPAEGQTLTIYMLQDGSGTNTIAWADTITWADNTVPTWTTTASKMNVAVITYIGGAYYGVGNKFA